MIPILASAMPVNVHSTAEVIFFKTAKRFSSQRVAAITRNRNANRAIGSSIIVPLLTVVRIWVVAVQHDFAVIHDHERLVDDAKVL